VGQKNKMVSKTLEQALKEVEGLADDLSAKIKIGEHWEEDPGEWAGGSRGGTNPGYYVTEPSSWIVEDFKPDTEKREAAKNKLQSFFDSSEWYSARYKAGMLLEIDTSSKIPEWIANLEKGLDSKIRGRIESYQTRRNVDDYGETREDFIEDEEGDAIRPDENKIQRTKDDVLRFYQLSHCPDVYILITVHKIGPEFSNYQRLQEAKKIDELKLQESKRIIELGKQTCPENKKELMNIYKSSIFPESQKQAGQSLGYCKPRIWLHNLFK
jgi:hypothetical protein